MFSLSVFFHSYGLHSLFLLVHLFLTHPAQHTDNTDFFPPLPSCWAHIEEVASVATGVCSRLPFCVYQNMLNIYFDWEL